MIPTTPASSSTLLTTRTLLCRRPAGITVSSTPYNCLFYCRLVISSFRNCEDPAHMLPSPWSCSWSACLAPSSHFSQGFVSICPMVLICLSSRVTYACPCFSSSPLSTLKCKLLDGKNYEFVLLPSVLVTQYAISTICSWCSISIFRIDHVVNFNFT